MPHVATADSPLVTPTATLVSGSRRSGFLPRLFGKRLVLYGEMHVYNFMQSLCPDYRGGFWNFLEYRGQPLYLAPTSAERYCIFCRTNGYEGQVSADAAGIIATLFALSHLSFDNPIDLLSDGYARLRDYAARHPESAEIGSAID